MHGVAGSCAADCFSENSLATSQHGFSRTHVKLVKERGSSFSSRKKQFTVKCPQIQHGHGVHYE